MGDDDDQEMVQLKRGVLGKMLDKALRKSSRAQKQQHVFLLASRTEAFSFSSFQKLT